MELGLKERERDRESARRVGFMCAAPAPFSRRIDIPLSHQLERFFGLVSVLECVLGRGRHRAESWPLCSAVCVASPRALPSLQLPADAVGSLGLSNKALIPTVMEPLVRLIRL